MIPKRAALAALVLVAWAACATAAPGPPVAARPTKTPAPAPVLDPVGAQYDAALTPGVGDSTKTRLVRFLAEHPRHPLTAPAQFELGLLAYARGDYAEARERFRRARSGGIADEARYWEGLSAFALGRPREARDAVLQTARAGRPVPRRWDSAYLVALSWAQEGRRPEALAAYRTLFELPAGPAQAAALYQAQRLAVDLQRSDEAAEWGKKLLSSYPQSPEAASFKAETARPAPAPSALRSGAAGHAPAGGKPAPAKKPQGR
jgi:tetratricopeptide (TPR) repeat protein